MLSRSARAPARLVMTLRLSIALALVALISTFVSAQAWGFAIFIVPWLALELWMVRRSGRPARIPDHRPADPVEIELDDT